MRLEPLFLRMPRGLMSRARLLAYRIFGMKQGVSNRMEGGGRVRRCSQVQIGSSNAFTQGAWLWPNDVDFDGIRIRVGSRNYFNRNLMIDAGGLVEIGDDNMFGPDVYLTDSNHRFGSGVIPALQSMETGVIKVGNRCWIGAGAIILKDVELGDGCVVAAAEFGPVPAQAVRCLLYTSPSPRD